MKPVYVVDAIRTPVGRYGGSLSTVRPDDLLATVLRALHKRNETLDPAAIEEVIAGAANQAGEDNRNVARMATLLAGPFRWLAPQSIVYALRDCRPLWMVPAR
jgi:acetyl-CoA acetyltransferase